ncbi:peptide ABC transporter substrate-binding protein [Actinobacillus equuli subsp. equuli]|uniref:peptide ABC transporter substrate-binding protein n=1 Tax=Actinobacillus equuli TaxID=718 RepID=UPI0024435820|nr:peptide ABC transporter substrate-binding protein [Actinobacillus equuli]WGE55388.1 peptide ABC transporter substrate-binding protein [Actinobacillus equuli subsp. equuli]
MLFLKQAVKFWRFFAICTVGVSLLSACDQKSQQPKVVKTTSTESSINKNILKRAVYAERLRVDPHFIQTSDEAAFIRDIFAGLVEFNEKGQIVPALAKDWFSENNKDWLFILDDSAKWSNGESVTADDFVASWQRLAAPKNVSPLAPYLVYMGIENAKEIVEGKKPVSELGVKALNSHSLQIKLSKPNAQLVKMLGHSALLPTFKGEVPKLNTLVTSSAYRIAEMSDRSAKLQAVKNGLDFATVEHYAIGDLQAIKQFDVIENPLPSQQHNIWEFPRLCTYYYEFNFADPQLKKKEVRQALKAIVLSARIPHLYGMANFSVLPRNMQASVTRQWAPVVVEPLLAQAGINVQNPLKLTLLYDDHGRHSVIANQMVRTLGESDLLQIQPQGVSWEQFLALREQKAFQLSRAGWCAEYADPLPFLLPFHSQSSDNKSNYANEMVDKQLEQLQHEKLSEEQRQQLIHSIVQQLEQDVAILPMFQYHRKVALDSTILGIDLHNDSEVIYSKHLYRMKPKD